MKVMDRKEKNVTLCFVLTVQPQGQTPSGSWDRNSRVVLRIYSTEIISISTTDLVNTAEGRKMRARACSLLCLSFIKNQRKLRDAIPGRDIDIVHPSSSQCPATSTHTHTDGCVLRTCRISQLWARFSNPIRIRCLVTRSTRIKMSEFVKKPGTSKGTDRRPYTNAYKGP